MVTKSRNCCPYCGSEKFSLDIDTRITCDFIDGQIVTREFQLNEAEIHNNCGGSCNNCGKLFDVESITEDYIELATIEPVEIRRMDAKKRG